MTFYSFKGVWPIIEEDVFIAPGAVIIGNAHIKRGASIWYNVVIRADTEPVVIGERTNIQDNSVIHVDPGAPCIIGNDCTVGHSAIVHGASVGNHVLIAMHATVLSHSVIEDECLIAAGSLVAEHKHISTKSLVMGVPGKVTRQLTEEELKRIYLNAAGYERLSKEHQESLFAAKTVVDDLIAGKE